MWILEVSLGYLGYLKRATFLKASFILSTKISDSNFSKLCALFLSQLQTIDIWLAAQGNMATTSPLGRKRWNAVWFLSIGSISTVHTKPRWLYSLEYDANPARERTKELAPSHPMTSRQSSVSASVVTLAKSVSNCCFFVLRERYDSKGYLEQRD